MLSLMLLGNCINNSSLVLSFYFLQLSIFFFNYSDSLSYQVHFGLFVMQLARFVLIWHFTTVSPSSGSRLSREKKGKLTAK